MDALFPFQHLFLPSSVLIQGDAFFAQSLSKLCGHRIIDVLYHKPSYARVYTICTSLKDFSKLIWEKDKKILVRVPVKPISLHSDKKKITVMCMENHITLELIFFNLHKKAVESMFPLHKEVYIAGELSFNYGIYTLINPKKTSRNSLNLELVYPLTKGITAPMISNIIPNAIRIFEKIPKDFDWILAQMRQENNWPSFWEMMHNLHDPHHAFDEKILERLAFDEILAHQLSILSARKKNDVEIKPLILNDDLQKTARNLLPYALTDDQEKALFEIDKDLRSNKPMHRLLQGDVGCGKTIVAFLSMLPVLSAGYQCALLAPTEILAQQHFEGLKLLADQLSIHVELFLGGHTSSLKAKKAEKLKNGEIHLAIGTHALIQQSIEFTNLKYIVIDEQHRFGVEQRLSLKGKGDNPHILMMTATPIPRTMVMTMYGDLEVSLIKTKPSNRKPIQTSVLSSHKESEIIEGLKRIISQGRQIYWVCPLIEESEKMDLANVTDRFLKLHSIFGDQVALLHGRMKGIEKQQTMQKFQDQVCKILVSTTVIEVGVDVPNATVMIIENAQRFGLSQLHQLRGRVGRGDQQSYCILIYDAKLPNTMIGRLEVMRTCEDGFTLSEMDLKIRGRGEILGTQQSGFKTFKHFDPDQHEQLLSKAILYAKILDQEKQEGKVSPSVFLEIFQKNEVFKEI